MRQPLPGGLRGGGFGARPLLREVRWTERASDAVGPTEIGFNEPPARSARPSVGTLSGVAHSTRGS